MTAVLRIFQQRQWKPPGVRWGKLALPVLTRKAQLPSKAEAVISGKQLGAVTQTPEQAEGGLTWAEEFQPERKLIGEPAGGERR